MSRYYERTLSLFGIDFEIFCFSSLDESWKVDAEGNVGAYQGMWNKDGQPEYA